MIVSDIVTPARAQLFDPAPGAAWSNTTMIGLVNQFISRTAFEKPDMYTLRDFVSMIAGTLQTLPVGPPESIAFFDADENSTGRMVEQTDKSLLDAANRLWPRGTQQAEVENFCADPRDPKRFLVFPPNDGTGSIRVLRGVLPPFVAALTDTVVGVPGTYLSAAISFVCGTALSIESKRKDPAMAAQYLNQWAQALGIKTQSQRALAPKVAVSEGKA